MLRFIKGFSARAIDILLQARYASEQVPTWIGGFRLKPTVILLGLGLALSLAGCQPAEEKKAETTPSAPPAAESPAAPTTQAASPAAVDEAALKAKGEKVYAANCASCHQANGEGMPNVFPPLAGGEIPNGDAAEHIKTVLKGKSGPITVKGKQYNGAMPPFSQLTDEDIAAVVTYERTTWGNKGGAVSPDQVKALR
ncbi:cytochrome c [bacterium]|nr:cytochrome c [bacterium]